MPEGSAAPIALDSEEVEMGDPVSEQPTGADAGELATNKDVDEDDERQGKEPEVQPTGGDVVSEEGISPEIPKFLVCSFPSHCFSPAV